MQQGRAFRSTWAAPTVPLWGGAELRMGGNGARAAAASSTEIGRPQGFEPSDGYARQRTLRDCGERLPEVVERADPDDPGRDVALAEHEAKRRLRPRAVAVAQRSVD